MSTAIKNNTMINHPNGVISLQTLQNDVLAFNTKHGSPAINTLYGFTSLTVQALIDKIVELQLSIAGITKSDVVIGSAINEDTVYLYIRDSRGFKHRIIVYDGRARDYYMCSNVPAMTDEEYRALPDKV